MNNCARIRCSLRPVTRLVVVAGFAHAGFGCASQRPDPSRTSFPQPGAVQGLGAEMGMVAKENPDGLSITGVRLRLVGGDTNRRLDEI